MKLQNNCNTKRLNLIRDEYRFEEKIKILEEKKEQIERLRINMYQLNHLSDLDLRLRHINYGMHAWDSKFKEDNGYFPNYRGLAGIDGPFYDKAVIDYYSDRGDPLCKALSELWAISDETRHKEGYAISEVIFKLTHGSDTASRINCRNLTLKEYLNRLSEANSILKEIKKNELP